MGSRSILRLLYSPIVRQSYRQYEYNMRGKWKWYVWYFLISLKLMEEKLKYTLYKLIQTTLAYIISIFSQKYRTNELSDYRVIGLSIRIIMNGSQFSFSSYMRWCNDASLSMERLTENKVGNFTANSYRDEFLSPIVQPFVARFQQEHTRHNVDTFISVILNRISLNALSSYRTINSV